MENPVRKCKNLLMLLKIFPHIWKNRDGGSSDMKELQTDKSKKEINRSNEFCLTWSKELSIITRSGVKHLLDEFYSEVAAPLYRVISHGVSS